MPAEKKEVEDAKNEGINFLFQNNIVEIIGKEKVEKLELIKTELVKNKMIKRITPQTTVNQWLSNIYNASFVVTDSFHGCVFSILFNKEFVVLPHELGGNARIKSLLKLFNLEERFVHHIDEINIQAPIYWDDVNYSLENLRKESINFLKSNLV